MNSAFNEQVLADKLSKLNSTQQCIETLSHWCIFHREKAEQVVQTWDKQFHSSQKEQKVPFLYLANDIIQNSRRKGNEFAIEFWKVLPAALKDVVENGDERAKNVVSRLVGIWEERKVFGSRGQDLKDLMLGNDPPPALELNKKRSRSVRIIKRDLRSVKIKLSVGGTAEKIVSALHTVLSERHNEDADLNKCQAAVHRVGKMEKDVDGACKKEGDPQRETLAKELQEHESVIQQCIEKLTSFEANRAALVAQLREALHEQESELESVRTQLQVAQAQIEEAANMRRRLNNEPPIPSTSSALMRTKSSTPTGQKTKKTAAAIAAEVADKLAASTYSQQIMTSVLSTFAAEEAKNAGIMSTSNPANSVPGNSSETRLKLDKSLSVSQASFVSAQSLSNTAAHQHQAVLVHQPSIQNQVSMGQPQFSVFPAPSQQFVQPSGAVLIGVPYTYTSLPPPPPPPVQVMNLARPPLTQQQQQTMAIMQTPPPPPPPPPMALQQSMSMNLQTIPNSLQPAPPSYRPLQPPSMGYYQHRSQ